MIWDIFSKKCCLLLRRKHDELLWHQILLQDFDVASAVTQASTDDPREAASPVQQPREPVQRDTVHGLKFWGYTGQYYNAPVFSYLLLTWKKRSGLKFSTSSDFKLYTAASGTQGRRARDELCAIYCGRQEKRRTLGEAEPRNPRECSLGLGQHLLQKSQGSG